MIVFESRAIRRVIGRLAREERVPEAFRLLASERQIATGWIQALGAFEWVEMVEYDQHQQKYAPARRVDAPCEILSMVGNLSFKDNEPFVHLHATVCREHDGSIEVYGGHVVDGSVFACEFFVECFDDLRLKRRPDPATGLALWALAGSTESDLTGRSTAVLPPERVTRPQVPPAEFGPQPISWADVVEASSGGGRVSTGSSSVPDESRGSSHDVRRTAINPPERITRPGSFVPGQLPTRRKTTDHEFLGEPTPQRGDWVEHKQFGTCRVEAVDADGGLIIRLASGRRTTLSLDALEVLPSRQDGVFPLQKRTK